MTAELLKGSRTGSTTSPPPSSPLAASAELARPEDVAGARAAGQVPGGGKSGSGESLLWLPVKREGGRPGALQSWRRKVGWLLCGPSGKWGVGAHWALSSWLSPV